MKKVFVATLPVIFGLTLAWSGSTFAQECDEKDPVSMQKGECKPLTRAEVKAEAAKAGVRTSEVGNCPNYAAAPTAQGKARNRAEVKRELAQAKKDGQEIQMGECPK